MVFRGPAYMRVFAKFLICGSFFRVGLYARSAYIRVYTVKSIPSGLVLQLHWDVSFISYHLYLLRAIAYFLKIDLLQHSHSY